MRRFSLLALIVGIVLIPLAYAVASSDHAQRIDQEERHLAGEADAHVGDLDAYYERARSAILLTANQGAFEHFVDEPGGRAFKLRTDGQNLQDAKRALTYLEQLYPGAIGEACFIDAAGNEYARVTAGKLAPVSDLSTEEEAATFFAPTFELSYGQVHQAAPYVSPDTKEWVVANATLVPARDGVKRAIVHFEVTIESLRREIETHSTEYEILVVDRRTGRVVIDGGLDQRIGAPLGTSSPTFAAFAARAREGGFAKVGGRITAYRSVQRQTGNVNDWVLVARSTTAAPTLMESVGLLPLGMLGLALLLCGFGAHGMRADRRELQSAATTDSLTGLANRRRLVEDLERRVARASGEAVVLLLFDLNGFKNYNDTFGHLAGDALLTRLGHALNEAVRPYGIAYRLGGDEFCVLATAGVRAEVEHAADRALSERGEGFEVTATGGAVLVPGEASTATDALRIADQRMYATKQSGRATAAGQSKDVLLSALAERHPDLGDHLDGVTELAVDVGRHLGLEADELQHVRHAAELHDIGKVAIPDGIIAKPGPLNDEEWGFMRRHTLIGERIIAAAPALGPVARLVRSSHERWDGGGYPDGLAGTDIPLGARIIAVCDAFNAMISNRPYSASKELGDALEELRRCSGSQFDPSIVATFAEVLSDRAAAPTAASA